MDSIQALFLFLREYTLDISEIDAETFKKELKALQDRFQADEKTRAIAVQFERQKSRILEHIQRQKRYLGERETEFREIIDLMTAAMTSLDQENIDFYGSIRVQGERFEEITLLNDIKRIKNELVQAVAKLREMVRRKEQQDQKNLDALSSQVEILKKELDNARHSANTDGLTGVYNRKALDHYLGSLVERNTITRTPFSLLMMDLDDFKQLNDTYGHTVGDRVLLAFTGKCRQLVRSDDFWPAMGARNSCWCYPAPPCAMPPKRPNCYAEPSPQAAMRPTTHVRQMSCRLPSASV
nr:GGDEF domain-containing protein [Desulfosarcina cetonica]